MAKIVPSGASQVDRLCQIPEVLHGNRAAKHDRDDKSVRKCSLGCHRRGNKHDVAHRGSHSLGVGQDVCEWRVRAAHRRFRLAGRGRGVDKLRHCLRGDGPRMCAASASRFQGGSVRRTSKLSDLAHRQPAHTRAAAAACVFRRACGRRQAAVPIERNHRLGPAVRERGVEFAFAEMYERIEYCANPRASEVTRRELPPVLWLKATKASAPMPRRARLTAMRSVIAVNSR